MTNREKIVYLKRYIWINKRITAKLEEIDRWRSQIGRITQTLTDMPIGGGSIHKCKDTDIINKIVDLNREIDKEVDELIEIREQIQKAITSVEDETLRTLLDYRYMQGMTFEWICSEMHFSWTWTHVLHKRALGSIELSLTP